MNQIRLATESALQSLKWRMTGSNQRYRSSLCGHLLDSQCSQQTYHLSSQPQRYRSLSHMQ